MDSNFVAIIATSAIFTALAGVSLALRFWTRRVTSAGYAADDWLAVASFGFAAALAITNILGVPSEGFGWQLYVATKDPAIAYLKVFFVAQFWFIAAVAATKLSVLYLLKRIFGSFETPTSIWILIWLTIAWAISFLIATLFQILPVWCNQASYTTATNYPWIHLMSSISDLILDIPILSLPIHFVRKLQMPAAKKIGIGGIFGLGLFCVIASTIRLYYTTNCMRTNMEGDNASDFAASADNFLMWSGIEASVSVTCVNLPTFGAIFTTVQERFFPEGFAPRSTHASVAGGFAYNSTERYWPGTYLDSPSTFSSERKSPRFSRDARSLSLRPSNSEEEKISCWKRLFTKKAPIKEERRFSRLSMLKGLRYSRTMCPREAHRVGDGSVSPIVEMSVVRTGGVDDDEFRILPCSPVEAAMRMV